MTLTFGNAPVPWTVSWTGEEGQFVAFCPHIRRQAICQRTAIGVIDLSLRYRLHKRSIQGILSGERWGWL